MFFYRSSEDRTNAQSVSVATVQGEYFLMSAEAGDMAALIERNLEGLRQRSVYAVAMNDASKTPQQQIYLFINHMLIQISQTLFFLSSFR